MQVDVKYVRIAGRWAFQYTALDDCTRFRVLRLYRHLHRGSSLAFLAELRRAFPFPIRRLQCDNGQEFPFEFALAVEAAGIRHRYIRPRRPQQNGKVERSHRIDHEEFWSRQTFPDFDAATCRPARVGGHLQLPAPLARTEGSNAGRKAGGDPAAPTPPDPP